MTEIEIKDKPSNQVIDEIMDEDMNKDVMEFFRLFAKKNKENK